MDPGRIRLSAVALEDDGILAEPLERAVTHLGGKLHRLPTGWLGIWRTARQVRRIAVEESVQLLHAHLLRPDVVGRLAVRALTIPYFVTEHGIHSWAEGPSGTAPFVRAWYRRTLGRTEILAISEKVRNDLLGAGLPSDRLHVVRNGIDLRHFQVASPEEKRRARKKFGIPPDAFPVLLALGSLIPRKAPEIPVEITRIWAAQEPSWGGCLMLAGSGPLEEKLRRQVVEGNLARRVILTGQLPDPGDALTASDILIHAATDEPFGLVAAEALASGLPVLARRGSGADNLLPSAPFCATVVGSDPIHWLDELQNLARLLARDQENLQGGCRAYAEKHHDIRQMVARLTDLYERAVACSVAATSSNPQKRSVSVRREN
jgi:glycosyltransferase involved in cell wall biosynthesis